MRLLWIFLGLALLVLIPFGIWSDDLMWDQATAITWLERFDRWGWLAGIGLLVVDLFLPVPGTVVMSALGYMYGTLMGGAVSATGSFLSGLLAYFLCRKLGRRAAIRLAGEKDLVKGEKLFAHSGGWLVAFSRWLPVFPEVIACMAGLTRMPPAAFMTALACGSVPMGFTYAAIGNLGVESPGAALALSAVVPLALWLPFNRWLRKREQGEPATKS
ncbi:MAG TPA: VTT domain-containing protein [Opitutaceae bacterium]